MRTACPSKSVSLLLLAAIAVVFSYGHRDWQKAEYLGNPYSDAAKMFYPLRDWGFREVAQNRLPLWNPLILCGHPNLAEMQSAILYPPNLIFVFFPAWQALNLCVALHLFLAGYFTFLLLRYYECRGPAALTGALVYMLGGPIVTRVFAGHLTILCVIAWTPLLLLLFDKAVRERSPKSALGGGGVLALALLAGYPQCVLYAIHSILLLGLALSLWRFSIERSWKSLVFDQCLMAAGLITGFLLAAMQLVPAWEFVGQSVRSSLGPEWVGTHSLPPIKLLTLILPSYFGIEDHHGPGYLWETMAYVGLSTLFLMGPALFRPRRRVAYFYLGLAALSLLLACSRFTPVFSLAYYGLPGFSLFRGHAKYLYLFALCAAILAGLGANALLSSSWCRTPSKYRVTAALILILVGTDLGLFAWRFFLVTPVRKSQFQSPIVFKDEGKALGWTRKAMHPELPVNWAMTQGTATAEGYVGNVTAGYYRFFRQAEGLDAFEIDFTLRRKSHGPLTRLFGESVPPIAGLPRGKLPSALPRAFLAHNSSRGGANKEEAPSPSEAAAISQTSEFFASKIQPIRKLISYRPGLVHLQIDNHPPGWLVLTDAWYPSWRARADGRERPVRPAYGAFQAVFLQPSEHDIIFFYDPLSFRIGLAVSFVSLSIWLGTVVFTAQARGSGLEKESPGE